jgi:hypothetical protein
MKSKIFKLEKGHATIMKVLVIVKEQMSIASNGKCIGT